MSQFDQLGLSPTLCKELEASGFQTATPIQAKAIPFALQGQDVMGLAQTGTGKTLAFGLPMVDQLRTGSGGRAPKSVKALVLAPTRELVNQIGDNLLPLARASALRLTKVVGGQSINRQISALAKGVDILIATPGRLIDLMEQGAVDLSTVRHLVLDEADQMLDMGFIHALRRIVPAISTDRQTMLFSATMPKQMEELSASYLKNPQKVQVTPPGKTADKIEQSVEFMEKGAKNRRLREILSEDLDALTLVFMRTKHGAERMMKQLKADGYNAASIHGNKSQGQRDRAIKAFRDGEVTILVATDVAARGIDIPGVAHVINYDLPNVPDSYVHRIGRTARAGRDGTAISLVSPEEIDMLKDIEKLIKRRFEGGPERGPGVRGPGKPKPQNRSNSNGKPGGKPRRRRGKGGGGQAANQGGQPRQGQGGRRPKKANTAG